MHLHSYRELHPVCYLVYPLIHLNWVNVLGCQFVGSASYRQNTKSCVPWQNLLAGCRLWSALWFIICWSSLALYRLAQQWWACCLTVLTAISALYPEIKGGGLTKLRFKWWHTQGRVVKCIVCEPVHWHQHHWKSLGPW